MWFECPHLGAPVELTDERRDHILWRHKELRSVLVETIQVTLLEPDDVMLVADDKHGFARWSASVSFGRFVVVVVREDQTGRFWISTAYTTVEPPRLEEL